MEEGSSTTLSLSTMSAFSQPSPSLATASAATDGARVTSVSAMPSPVAARAVSSSAAAPTRQQQQLASALAQKKGAVSVARPAFYNKAAEVEARKKEAERYQQQQLDQAVKFFKTAKRLNAALAHTSGGDYDEDDGVAEQTTTTTTPDMMMAKELAAQHDQARITVTVGAHMNVTPAQAAALRVHERLKGPCMVLSKANGGLAEFDFGDCPWVESMLASKKMIAFVERVAARDFAATVPEGVAIVLPGVTRAEPPVGAVAKATPTAAAAAAPVTFKIGMSEMRATDGLVPDVGEFACPLTKTDMAWIAAYGHALANPGIDAATRSVIEGEGLHAVVLGINPLSMIHEDHVGELDALDVAVGSGAGDPVALMTDEQVENARALWQQHTAAKPSFDPDTLTAEIVALPVPSPTGKASGSFFNAMPHAQQARYEFKLDFDLCLVSLVSDA